MAARPAGIPLRPSLRSAAALLSASALLGTLMVAGCGEAGPGPGGPVLPGDGKADSSAIATFLTFEFDGELVTDGGFFFGGDKQLINDQLLYTVGHLNGDNSVGRLDKVDLTNVKRESLPDGKTRVTYHAVMPVAWGSKTNVPTSYEFRLPRDISSGGKRAFTDKYKSSCVDYSAHDVDVGSMWYYYRPASYRCQLADADVVRLPAAARPSGTESPGKYPEYHKVWEDNELRVLAIFGKYEDGAKTSSDAGISAFNEFVGAMQRELTPYGLETTPATLPVDPGVTTPDVTFSAKLADGKLVTINALLVDNVRVGSQDYDFDARYNELSTRADLIAYNGHAGLGDNVRALARKGAWEAGQYMIFFSNGCDTFAYVDGYLAETRAAVNPDDPKGTKYMEIIANALPAYFVSMTKGTLAFTRGLMAHDRPMTYEQMFAAVDSSQVVLVTGDEDNVFEPGYTPPAPPAPPADPSSPTP